jgi:hypothetical protein
MEEVVELGNAMGSYYVLPVEDRFRVFPAQEVEADPRVSSLADLLDDVKRDFGDSTSYVVYWVQPAFQ